MKKHSIKSSVLAGISALLMLFPMGCGELKDVTKPYMGIYKCKQAKLGEYDYLDKFDELALELKGDGEFILHYQEKDGAKKTETGKYSYDKENETITLVGGAGGIFKREFPLQGGALTIDVKIAEKNLLLRFERD